MKRNFSPIKAQQAPAASPPGARQALASGALHTASINAHSTRGGIVRASRYSASNVRIVLKTPPNRLTRSHSITPLRGGRGRSAAIGARSARSVIQPLRPIALFRRKRMKAKIQSFRGRLQGGARNL